ncbi:MAG TPA: GPP34 family phosphoprotein [Streptomyces sp.]|nr:GPP34 family phosphoprotein [Streptomyces sp.]
MTMGDELLLIAMGTGRRRPRIRSEGRLRAAELSELCLVGRIAFGVRRIEILDTAPVEDRRLNNVLAELRRADPPPSLYEWLRLAPRSLTTEYLSRLEDQKALKSRRRRDAVGHTRYEILSVDAPRRRRVLDRLDAVAASGPEVPADPYDLALALLVRVADVATAPYPGVRGASLRRRLAARTEDDALLVGAAHGEGDADAPTVHIHLPAGKLGKQLVKQYKDIATDPHGLDQAPESGGSSDGGPGQD